MSRSGRIVATVFAALVCAAGLFDFWRAARTYAAIDFYQMWAGARMAREASSVYDPAAGARFGEALRQEAIAEGGSLRHVAAATYRRNLEIFSSPFLYTLYGGFPRSYERALTVFYVVVMFAFAAAIATFATLFRWPLPATMLLFGGTLIAYEPVRSDVIVGNSNIIVLALVAVSALLTRLRLLAAAGAILAVATIAKPHIAFAIPLLYVFWLAARRWRDLATHAAGAAAGTTVAIVVACIYFRLATIWFEWIRALRALPEEIVPVALGNFGLAVLVREWTGVRPSFALLIVMAIIAIVLAIRVKTADDVLVIAIGATLFHVVSPLVWLHYYVLTLPLLMWLLRPARGEGATRRQMAGFAALLLLSVRAWDEFAPTAMHVAALVNAGLLIALAAAVSLLRENRVQAYEQRDRGEDRDDGDEHRRT